MRRAGVRTAGVKPYGRYARCLDDLGGMERRCVFLSASLAAAEQQVHLASSEVEQSRASSEVAEHVAQTMELSAQEAQRHVLMRQARAPLRPLPTKADSYYGRFLLRPIPT